MSPRQHPITAEEDWQAAVALQASLLPADLPHVPGLGLASRYVSGSGIVGGDWYDVFILPDGKSLGVIIGDVAGSGLPAAVVMGRMRSALRAYVLETADPAVALDKLDRKIRYFEDDAMATVLYGVYAPGLGELTLSTAGHPPPVLVVPGLASAAGPVGAEPASVRAELTSVEADLPIGVADDPDRRSTVISIPPGGTLCFYTDGLVERRDESIEVGLGRLVETLRDFVAAAPPGESLAEDACDFVMQAMAGDGPRDDVALLILHRAGS